jgi:DnaJ family protein A protein 5
MKCYYEVLQVERNASSSDILKAYRKQALLHHPDKNRHRIEEATEYFTAIQEAYQILSDEHERKWYDIHREEILRGPLDFSNRGTSEYLTKEEITEFHNRKSFLNFDDKENGFYTVYRNLFIKIDLEEQKAQQSDVFCLSTDDIEFHSFGDSTATTESLSKFYNRFLSFSSIKSFCWFDMYRPLDYPDRYQRRIAEKKNKKLRDEARKEFNDSVCELALWLRKRDPRIQKLKKDQEKVQQIQKEKVKELQRQEREKRILEAKEYVEPEWSKGNDSDIEIEVYECVVCDLEFQTEKQMKRHENSQYHLQQVEILRAELEQDDLILQGEDIPVELEELVIESFDCQVCDKQFQSESQLNQHLNSKKHRQQVKEKTKSSSNSNAPSQSNLVTLVASQSNLNEGKPLAELDTVEPPAKSQSMEAKSQPKAQKKKKPKGIYCNTCKETFPSKTKLFNHLETTGHAKAK